MTKVSSIKLLSSIIVLMLLIHIGIVSVKYCLGDINSELFGAVISFDGIVMSAVAMGVGLYAQMNACGINKAVLVSLLFFGSVLFVFGCWMCY